MKKAEKERKREEKALERKHQLQVQVGEREHQLQVQVGEREQQLQVQVGEREYQLQLFQLQNQGHATQTPNRLQLTKILPLLPQFSDYDPEAFFREFESSATHFQLPKEDWKWLVKPKLNGKALSVLDRVQDNTDYDVVKDAILTAYVVTTERYQQNFRNMNKKTTSQTYLEFASEKLRTLKNWLKSASVTTYDDLVNLVVLEEFKRKIPYSIMLHITNKDETNLPKAAKIADVFFFSTSPCILGREEGSAHCKFKCKFQKGW